MYTVQLVINPLTVASLPAEITIKVPPCIVRGVEITHPTGCASLVGIWFEYQSNRLWPIETNTYYLGNGSPIVFNPDRELSESPFELTIKGYNSDDTYIHRPLIVIDVDFIKIESVGFTQSELNELRELFGL